MNDERKHRMREKADPILKAAQRGSLRLWQALGTKKRQITAGVLSFAMVLTTVPGMSLTALAATDVATVTFDGSTTNYSTIDDAWAAAIACETTAEKR